VWVCACVCVCVCVCVPITAALSLDHRIGNFLPGKEADFVVLDPCATPLMARCVCVYVWEREGELYMYIYIYIHIHIYILCVCVCVCVCAYIYIYMYVCKLCGAWPPVPTHCWQGVYVYVGKRDGGRTICVSIYKFILCMCVCVCVCVCIYMYICGFYDSQPLCHTIDGKGWVSVLERWRERGLYPLMEEIRQRIFGSQSIRVSRISRWLPLLSRKLVWNLGDSRKNLFESHGDFRENFLEFLAIVILGSPISSVCGCIHIHCV